MTPPPAAAAREPGPPAPMAEVRQHAGEAAELLKALANRQRLLVLCALLDGAKSVGEINARVPLSQSALSQHLAVLRARALVTTERRSQTIYYALSEGPALEILGVLYRTYCAQDERADGAGEDWSPRRGRRGAGSRRAPPCR